MAVAACFGGPVLNLLVGTGAPVLGASFKHGILPFRLSVGITSLFLETVRSCPASSHASVRQLRRLPQLL